jgi:hypothetical protein
MLNKRIIGHRKTTSASSRSKRAHPLSGHIPPLHAYDDTVAGYDAWGDLNAWMAWGMTDELGETNVADAARGDAEIHDDLSGFEDQGTVQHEYLRCQV